MQFAKNNNNFIGSDVLKAKYNEGVENHLVYCEVDVSDADPIGNEPIFDGGEVIGITTSGAYGHYLSKSLAIAYVRPGYETAGTQFDIKILGGRCKATVLSEPAWDPKNVRLSS